MFPSYFIKKISTCLPFAIIFVQNAYAEHIQDMIDLINQARYSNGMGQLFVDGVLTQAAQAHAADLARRNYMSHWTPEGWSQPMRVHGWGWPQGSASSGMCQET